MSAPQTSCISLPRLLGLGFLSWLSILGVDLVVHAGVLARLYAVADDPFLLPPHRAFALIPVGYLSSALLTVMLVWLMVRARVVGIRAGAAFGIKLGIFLWGAVALGLFSISTARPALLLGWLGGGAVQMAIGGAVAGAGLSGRSLVKISVAVGALLIAAAAVTAVMQNVGLAPAVRANR